MSTAVAINLESLVLLRGSHDTREEGCCFMEAAAWAAGEPHSDESPSVCPRIGSFLRTWNDDLDDTSRQILKPYITKVVGTRSTRAVEYRREWMLTDWMVRVYTPAWLRLARLDDEAIALEQLGAITSPKRLALSRPALEAARAAAVAAWAAAQAEVPVDSPRGAAFWDAAKLATTCASGAAAAGEVDAWEASWTGAWAAAAAAAAEADASEPWAVLRGTEAQLQQSALQLLDRMIAAGKEAA